MVTYYDLLGVKRQATFEQIRRAYRLNVAAYHPDINDAPNAVGLTVLLNAAWETLSEPELRKTYDELLMVLAPTIERSNEEAAKRRASREQDTSQPKASSPGPESSERSTTSTGSAEGDRSSGETVAVTVLGGQTLPFEIIVQTKLSEADARNYPDGPYRIAMYQDGRYIVIDARGRTVLNFARSMAIFFRACKMSGVSSYQRSRLAGGRPAVLPNT